MNTEKLIPHVITTNPYRGGMEAYLATEHYNEGWNDCREKMQELLEIAQREEGQSLAELLETIDIKAQAGLCQFSHAGTRAFIQDIRDLIAACKALEESAAASPEPTVEEALPKEGRVAELAKHLREQAKIFREEDELGRGAKELEEAANLLEVVSMAQEPLCYTTPEAVEGMRSGRAAGYSVHTFPMEGIEVPLYTKSESITHTEHAEVAAAATSACACRTAADGWIFENTTQLLKFVNQLK
jgi:predicted house-cleaning noncanonical NTP pyrophosphatase (MazG superfamily)